MRPTQVAIFADYICPFCYIGARRVARLESEFGIEVEWKAFELHPEAPEGGIPPSMFFEGDPRRKRIGAAARDLAERAGLWLEESIPYSNSRLALELGLWAQVQGRGRPFRDALFRAHYADGRDIGRQDVLIEIAAAAGLDPDAAWRQLIDRPMSPEVERHTVEAAELGVTGVPTFLIGRRLIAGAQPYEVLREAYAREAGARCGGAA